MNNITKTEIIMGSIRSGIDIVDAQLSGAHIVTAGLSHYIKISYLFVFFLLCVNLLFFI